MDRMIGVFVDNVSDISLVSLLVLLYHHSYTAGVSSLLVCALVASMLMIALGILSEQEARDAVNWDIFITIAAAFGIGTALVNSGVAGAVADFLVTVGTSVGDGCKCVQNNSSRDFSLFGYCTNLLHVEFSSFFQPRVYSLLSIWPHS
jgi:hypothetical protein